MIQKWYKWRTKHLIRNAELRKERCEALGHVPRNWDGSYYICKLCGKKYL